MATTVLTREEIAAARAERIEAAQQLLAEAVAEIRSGEDWQRFLGFQAQLHAYSPNNSLLIAIQHQRLYGQGKVPTPLPTYVASYRRWQQLGRQVQRGQTGMAIIAPMRGTRREASDRDGNVRRLGRDEQPHAGEVEARSSFLRGFTVEKVFSAEQTQGADLPEAPRPQLLAGQAPRGLGEAVLRLVESRGFTVCTVPAASDLHGANGMTTFSAKTVQVRADMDDAAMVRCLLHEAAHVLLHDPHCDTAGALLPRGQQEVEAESVAFVVAHAHGMNTDDYSFPYVAAWAGDDPDAVMATTAQRVAAAARTLIAASPAEHLDGGRPAPARELTADVTSSPVVAAPAPAIGL